MIIAIDFDGTIVKHAYPKIGGDIGAFDWLSKLQQAGAKLILFTMRSGNELLEAVDYCKRNGIEFYGINTDPGQQKWTSSPKAYANIYIDDAAYGCPVIRPKEGRPYVDWNIVGPAVLRLLRRYNREHTH